MPLPAGLTPVGGGLPPGLSPVDDDEQPVTPSLPKGLAPVGDSIFAPPQPKIRTPFQEAAASRFASLEASAPPSERLSVKNAIADTRAFAAKPLVNISHAIGMDDPDKMAAISNVLDPATVLAGTAGIKAAEGFTSPEGIAALASPVIGTAMAVHGATQLPGQAAEAYRDLRSGNVSRFATESGPTFGSNLAMTTALGVGHGREIAARGREAIRPPELDMSTIRPEDLGAESRVPDTATAEGTPNVANARKAEAVAAMEKFKEELPPERPAPPPQPPADNGPFHGSREPVDLTPDGHLISDKNIYGGGMYTTDNRGVADGYAKGSGNVYRAVEKIQNPPVKMYDLDAPADPSLFHGDDHPLGMEAASLIEQNPGLPLSRVLDELRGMSADLGIPRWGVQEYIDGLQERVRADGYGGFSHEGGRLRGGDKHGVKIYFDPKEQVDLIGADKPAVAAPQPFDADPNSIIGFNKWVDENAPPGGYREIQDAAAGHAEKPTDVEIQQAARELEKLDRTAAEAPAAAEAAGADRPVEGDGPAESTSLRAADPAARSTGSPEAGAPEAGNPRDVQRPAEAGQAAPGAEGIPVEGEPDLTHRSIRDFQRAANVPEYEGSRFSRSNQGIRDAVAGNEAALVERGRRARVGEALSDEVQYALKQHTDNLVRNGGDPEEIQRNYQILAESGSAKGRQLQALQTAIDQVDHTDPAAVVHLANKVTQGKLSIQAQMDLADMAKKASKMKEASDASINKRAEAALARLEGMGEQIKRLTIKDVIGCR